VEELAVGKLLKGPAGGGQQGGQGTGGGIGDLLNNLTGGGGLGSILGAGVGAGAGNQMGGGIGSTSGGGLAALIPVLLPAILGMLGRQRSPNQTGMHQLVDTMHANGLGHVAQSWVGTGPSQPITADQVQQVLTPDQLAELSATSGLPQEQVKAGAAAILPHVVHHLTPDGAMPDPTQVTGATDALQGALAGLTPGQP